MILNSTHLFSHWSIPLMIRRQISTEQCCNLNTGYLKLPTYIPYCAEPPLAIRNFKLLCPFRLWKFAISLVGNTRRRKKVYQYDYFRCTTPQYNSGDYRNSIILRLLAKNWTISCGDGQVMPGISAFKHDQGNPFTVSKGKGMVSRDDFFKSDKP
jgi:hypothetical protein